MNLAIDNVERRDSCPRLSPQQVEDALDAERRAELEEAYEHHLREARTAIQMTPVDLVTPAFIGSVLDSLSARAFDAQLPEISEKVGILSDEVTP